MGSADLRKRATWQDYSGHNAAKAEHTFFETFTNLFLGTEYSIRPKPKEFNKIYVDVRLSNEVMSQIYNPKDPITKHGISPDYAIDNRKTGKTLYVEVKRQDGWVEGKPRSAGRGNAHERSCKYFTPGLLKTLRSTGGIQEPHLPFWTVFQGDLTRDPCRVREISLWYQGYEKHFFMWRDNSIAKPIIDHFVDELEQVLL